uniref:Uncharacterized protein LOC116941727 n=1 Tax=Petromyzon marinus TaxID=7757 RepID=A0AAJ7T0N9_PETMA|nr:uncharacterized protein LOC116941727 [Petromyzon marinus]
MAFWTHLRLLLWKNFTLRKRQKVRLLLELTWPLFLFVILVLVRNTQLPYRQHQCFFPNKPLPSAGALPWLQGVLCNANNPCFSQPTPGETPGQLNNFGGDIQHLLSNETQMERFDEALEDVRGLSHLAETLRYQPDVVAGRGVRVRDFLREDENLTLFMQRDMGLPRQVSTEILEMRVRLEQFVEGIPSLSLKEIVCDDQLLRRFLVFRWARARSTVRSALCLLPQPRLQQLEDVLYANVDFYRLLREVGAMRQRMPFVLDDVSPRLSADGWREFTSLQSFTSLRREASFLNSLGLAENTSDGLREEQVGPVLSSLSGLLCGHPEAGGRQILSLNWYEDNDYKTFLGIDDDDVGGGNDEERQGGRRRHQYDNSTTPFCNALLQSLQTNSASRFAWTMLQPLLQGKILYSPDTPATRSIMHEVTALSPMPPQPPLLLLLLAVVEANRTFAELEMIYKFGLAWEEVAPQIWDFLNSSLALRLLRETLGNVAVATFVDSQLSDTGLDARTIADFLSAGPSRERGNGTAPGWREMFTVVDVAIRSLTRFLEQQHNSHTYRTHEPLNTHMKTSPASLSRRSLNLRSPNVWQCMELDKLEGVQDEPGLERRALELLEEQKLWAGVVFLDLFSPSALPQHLRYKIRTDIDRIERTSKSRDRYWDPGPRADAAEDMSYIWGGFAYLQDMVERGIVQAQTGAATIGLYLQQMPYPCFVDDVFTKSISNILPMFMTLAFILPVCLTIKSIVWEKECRLKEVLRASGLGRGTLWAAWFIDSALIMVVSCTLLAVIIKYGKVLQYSDPLVLFLFLTVFAIATVSQCLLLSVFFSRANLAAACGGLAYFLLYLPHILCFVWQDYLTFPIKMGVSLLSTVAFGFGCESISRLEEQGIGIQWHNLASNPAAGESYTLLISLLMMLCDAVLYGILTWYIEAVFPGQYGVPKPWHFPFTSCVATLSPQSPQGTTSSKPMAGEPHPAGTLHVYAYSPLFNPLLDEGGLPHHAVAACVGYSITYAAAGRCAFGEGGEQRRGSVQVPLSNAVVSDVCFGYTHLPLSFSPPSCFSASSSQTATKSSAKGSSATGPATIATTNRKGSKQPEASQGEKVAQKGGGQEERNSGENGGGDKGNPGGGGGTEKRDSGKRGNREAEVSGTAVNHDRRVAWSAEERASKKGKRSARCSQGKGQGSGGMSRSKEKKSTMKATKRTNAQPDGHLNREEVLVEEESVELTLGVSVQSLVKKYSTMKRPAVDGLSLNFYQDQITSFLGHNGAGKTTTMSILTGLFPPTSGTALIYGKDIRTEMESIRSSLGTCPQHNVLFNQLTVEEHIWFYARLKGCSSEDAKEEVERMLEDTGLLMKRAEHAENLSGGMQRKLSVAMAFVAGSRLVILDEPTAGVDPFARRGIWELLLKYKHGRTIILSTHHMDEAETLGDRIAVIARGRLRCCGSPLYLKSCYGTGYYLTVVRSSADVVGPSGKGQQQPAEMPGKSGGGGGGGNLDTNEDEVKLALVESCACILSHSFCLSFTHLLSRLITHSLVYFFTCSFTQSFANSTFNSLTASLLNLLTHACYLSLTNLFTRSHTHSPTQQEDEYAGRLPSATEAFCWKHRDTSEPLTTVAPPPPLPGEVLILQNLVERLVPGARVVENVGQEVTFMLPYTGARDGSFALLFSHLDSKLEGLGISSYGVSDTTMEEIFLKVAEDPSLETEHKDEGVSTKGKWRWWKEKNILSPSKTKEDMDIELERRLEEKKAKRQKKLNLGGGGSDHMITGGPLAWQQFRALIIKRFHHTRRSRKGFLSQIILPAVFVCLALVFTMIVPPFADYPELELQPWMYPEQFTFYSDDAPNDLTTQKLVAAILDPPGLGTRCMIGYSIPNLPCQPRMPVWETPQASQAAVDALNEGNWTFEDPSPSCRCSTPERLTMLPDCPPGAGGLPPPQARRGLAESSAKLPKLNKVGDSASARSRGAVHHGCRGVLLNKSRCATGSMIPAVVVSFTVSPPSQMLQSTTDTLQNLTGRNISDYLVKSYADFIEKSLTRKYWVNEPRYGGFSLGQKNEQRDVNATALRRLFQQAGGFLNITAGPAIEEASLNLEGFIQALGPTDNVKVWFNNKGWHAIVAFINVASNAVLRARLPEGKDPRRFGITAYNHPLNLTKQQLTEVAMLMSSVDVMVSICVIFSMSLIPASFAVFLVQERASNAKHLQFVSGVNAYVYWLANITWDMCNYILPAIIVVVIFLSFQQKAYVSDRNLPALILLLLLYGWSITPLMYPASFVFTVPSTAYVVLTCVNLFIGINGSMATFILELFKGDETLTRVNDILKSVLLIFPHFCLGRGLIDMATNQALADASERFGENRFKEPLSWDMVGKNLFAMFIEGSVFIVLTLLIQKNFFIRPRSMKLNLPPITDEDVDVAAERKRVMEGDTSTDILTINELTKVYKKKGAPAVDRMCVGVRPGECFGLLGVNGAGKTSAFRMLTGDTHATAGDARLEGYSILSQLSSVQSRLGYCPQFDGTDELLTGREHLQLYARLRGVREEDLERVVEWAVSTLGLIYIADRSAGSYSGGNKRKLSTAIALIGNPPLVFLDEPTTGMDPKARRFLWNCILAIVQAGRSVVLTSHSMEECESLCTRMAIMVSGTFRCLGSVQHIKTRFGEGHTLVIRLAAGTPPAAAVTADPAAADTADAAAADPAAAVAAAAAAATRVAEYVCKRFPRTELRERHHRTMYFHLPGAITTHGASGASAGATATASACATLSTIFAALSENQQQLGIADFSVSQTTLDQVFVSFARQQWTDPVDEETGM